MAENKTDYEALKVILQKRLNEKRYYHSLCVAQEARRLAEKYGGDSEKAYLAGLLHDITKKLVLSDQLILCRKYGIISDNAEEENVKLLHAKTGAALARDLFNISDEVYDAIRWHTTGKPDMTLLEKIVYLGDMISAERSYKDVDKFRKICYDDLDKAMSVALAYNITDVCKKCGQLPHYTVEAYNFYLKYNN